MVEVRPSRSPIAIAMPDDIDPGRSVDRLNATSMAFHELREPLQAIRSFLAVVLDGRTGPLTELQQDFLVSANQAVRRAGRVVEDLQVLLIEGEIRDMRRRPVDLAERITACCREVAQLTGGAAVTLHAEHPTRQRLVLGDIDRIDQVLLILLEQAIQHAPQHTAIEVGTSAPDEARWSVMMAIEVGDGLIPSPLSEWLASLGQEAGVPDYEFGLGPVVVHLLVRAHDGELNVARDGNRSRISISFPRYEAA